MANLRTVVLVERREGAEVNSYLVLYDEAGVRQGYRNYPIFPHRRLYYNIQTISNKPIKTLSHFWFVQMKNNEMFIYLNFQIKVEVYEVILHIIHHDYYHMTTNIYITGPC